ncbi:MAG: hypothetical protein JWR55_150 [Aeromicrobium sp.]|nr:hypothetical protein [Aeromicrobium sp.]
MRAYAVSDSSSPELSELHLPAPKLETVGHTKASGKPGAIHTSRNLVSTALRLA